MKIKLLIKLCTLIFSFLTASFAQMVIDFENFSGGNRSNGTGNVYFTNTAGTGSGFDAINLGDDKTWYHDANDSGINDAATGDGSGADNTNLLDSTGVAMPKAHEGNTSYRVITGFYKASNFQDGLTYEIEFDVNGDANGNSSPYFYLAAIDYTAANSVVQITCSGFDRDAPITTTGGASAHLFHDKAKMSGATTNATTSNKFTFTYDAALGSDIVVLFASGNNNYSFDNFKLSSVPEPSMYAVVTGILVFGFVAIKRIKN